MTYSEKAAANLERYRTEPSRTEGTPNWLKGLGAGLLVATTGPIGILLIGVYYLRKQSEEQQKQTALLTQSTITPEQK